MEYMLINYTEGLSWIQFNKEEAEFECVPILASHSDYALLLLLLGPLCN